MSKPVLGALVLAAVLSGLTACSSDADPAPAIELGDDASSAAPSSSAPASPTGSSAAPQTRPDEKGHEAIAGDAPAGGDRAAVAQAWVDYWQVRLDAFYDAELDPAALGAVAQGDAAGQVISYVADLKQRNAHVEGDMVLNVGKVKVVGDKATFESCVQNFTTDRDAKGKPTEPLTPFYQFRADAVRVPDGWTVTGLSKSGSVPCE